MAADFLCRFFWKLKYGDKILVVDRHKRKDTKNLKIL